MGNTCFKCGKELVPTCPECGGPVDVYSRVVGYLRPVHTWNDGKVREFADRKEYVFWQGDHISEMTTDYTDEHRTTK